MNHDGLNNPGGRSPKEHFYQIILKSIQLVLTRLKFSEKISKENRSHPLVAMFLMNHDGQKNNLGRGSPKEHFYQIILKSVQWFLTRRFFKVYKYIGKISHGPWSHDSLNNLGRGSPKEHFCKIILKYVHWFPSL